MTRGKSNFLRQVYSFMLKFGTFVFAGILICVSLSNLAVVSPNWPYGLVASFSYTLIIILPFIIAALFVSWRKAVFPMLLLAILAFFPLYSFKDYVRPMGGDCRAQNCLSIVAVNLRHYQDALIQFTQSDAQNADILLISELPHEVTQEELKTLFPMDGQGQVALITDPQLHLGSRLAVVTRKPLDDVALQIEHFPNTKIRPRGIVEFNYTPPPSGDPISIRLVHAPPPKGRLETASRDAYLRAASRDLSGKSNFILMGDFNMTPWESGFSALPGKRAGNPRWNRTWNARKFWQHIAIDHALIGDGLALIESEVLADIGSDHFPIRIVVQPK